MACLQPVNQYSGGVYRDNVGKPLKIPQSDNSVRYIAICKTSMGAGDRSKKHVARKFDIEYDHRIDLVHFCWKCTFVTHFDSSVGVSLDSHLL